MPDWPRSYSTVQPSIFRRKAFSRLSIFIYLFLREPDPQRRRNQSWQRLLHLYIILLGWGFLYALGRSFHWKSLFRGSCRFHRHPDSQNLEPLDWRQRFVGGLGTHPASKNQNKLDSGALIEAASAFVLCCSIVFRSPGSAVNQHDGVASVYSAQTSFCSIAGEAL